VAALLLPGNFSEKTLLAGNLGMTNQKIFEES
jgi:hypothetical protein